MQTSYQIRTAEDFAVVLRNVRTQKKLTQSQLAAQIGMTRRWVSDVERGAIIPTLQAVLSAMRVLGYGMAFNDHRAGFDVDLIALALGE